MSELRTELETELRALDIATAPVAGTMRAGRRLRYRRRFAVAAGVAAVIAIAAGVPAATRAGAAPPRPVTRPHGDPVVTESAPGRGAPAGEVAQGTIGALTWRVTFARPGHPAVPPGDVCLQVTVAGAGTLSCDPDYGGAAPVTFDSQSLLAGPGGMEEATSGVVAADVDYFLLTFADGQQLKLIPVTSHGHRSVVFVAPVSMAVASLTAHLGGAGHDNGQTETAVPYSQPDQLPLFELWQRPGQAAAPRATRVLASGIADGKPWSLTAYEGPWGTCFVPVPASTTACKQSLRLATTEIIGGWAGTMTGGVSGAYGSAAPGVASIVVQLSNGRTVTARPVTVGNERLFAVPTGPLQAVVSATGWTAYSASGKVIGQAQF